MMKKESDKDSTRNMFSAGNIGSFLLDVLGGFRRNQGLLLSGAMAYYTLLALIPMLAIILVALSHVIEEEKLFLTVVTHLEMIIPSYSEV